MRSRHARLRNSIKRRKQPLVERRALPTPERLRRAGADVERGDSGQITMRDSPLERAFARNALTAEQYSAGQKYRHHWYHAGLAGRLGSLDLNRILAVDSAPMRAWRRRKTSCFTGNAIARRCKPSARSDRAFWNGRCAGKWRSTKSVTLWAGAAARKPMRPRLSA
jgi:hypothetical protein